MVDAYDLAIGGIVQTCLNDTWSSIAFFSKRLTPSQRKYNAFHRELFAMYLTVQYFCILLKERSSLFLLNINH